MSNSDSMPRSSSTSSSGNSVTRNWMSPASRGNRSGSAAKLARAIASMSSSDGACRSVQSAGVVIAANRWRSDRGRAQSRRPRRGRGRPGRPDLDRVAGFRLPGHQPTPLRSKRHDVARPRARARPASRRACARAGGFSGTIQRRCVQPRFLPSADDRVDQRVADALVARILDRRRDRRAGRRAARSWYRGGRDRRRSRPAGRRAARRRSRRPRSLSRSSA